MKNLVLFGIFVLLLVAVQFAGGQSVDEIIEKHIRAKGGLDKLDAIRSMYMEGLITLMGITAGIKIAKERSDANPAGFNMQWFIAPPGESFLTTQDLIENTPFAEEMMAEMQAVPDMSAHLAGYAAKGHAAVLIGKEVVEEMDCYHLKLTISNKRGIDYWISKKDFLLLRTSFTKAGADICISYGNYKAVDEILLAHTLHIQKVYNHQNIAGEMVFNLIQINEPFPPIIVTPINQL